jgi:hypothetical protein
LATVQKATWFIIVVESGVLAEKEVIPEVRETLIEM